jgi:hypothetical protein
MASSARWALSATCISAAAVAAVVLYRFDPSAVHFYPVCPFHALTGLQCPGCGTTRALHHLLHGDVAGAFRLNAMLFVGAPFVAAAAFSRRFATHPVTGWAAVGMTAAWWILRNLLHA